MSQSDTFPSVNETSSGALNNSDEDDDWKSLDNITIRNNNGWANFDAFENNTNQNSESIPLAISNEIDDEWADFQSNTEEGENTDKAVDGFGDYSVVQISSISHLPINSLNTDQTETLMSTCFPLESPIPSVDTDNLTPFELPSFTTFKDQTKQLPCLKSSLCLWNVLSNIANDPIGIQYQWRKSNTERFFHQGLGVHERLRIKTVSSISATSTANSNVDNENKSLPQNVDPHFDWKRSGLENPLTDTDSSSLPINSSKNEENVFDVNKTLDLDYYVPTRPICKSNKDESITSSPTIHRNNSPITQQQSTPIKTMDLFPGSTTVLNEDPKPVVNTTPNFSFMNPKALMSSTQITHDSAM